MCTHLFVSTFVEKKYTMKKEFKSKYPVKLDMKDENGRPLNYCGIRCSMEVLGGKWKLLIVASLFKKKMRYSELRKSIPEISEKMLISSLQELEYQQIVHRHVFETIPPQVEYSLTEYGLQTKPLLELLFAWGENHIENHGDLIFQ